MSRQRRGIDPRDTMPTELRRAVLVEAGHRCAIQVCKQTPVDVAHIVPWEEIKRHDFSNLIALCPNCHKRYDSGQIDRNSMRLYKWQVGLIDGRLGDVERRILRTLAGDRAQKGIWWPESLELIIGGLLEDDFLTRSGERRILDGVGQTFYRITERCLVYFAVLPRT